MWSNGKDSGDSLYQTGSKKEEMLVLNNIKSWFKPQSGFISLQHDTNDFGIKIALDVIKAMDPSLVLYPQSVSMCTGDTFGYRENMKISNCSLSNVKVSFLITLLFILLIKY